MPAIQLVNYFIYPLQLLLFIQFIRAGVNRIDQNPLPLDFLQIFSILQDNAIGTINSVWWMNLRAIAALLCVELPKSVAVFLELQSILLWLSKERIKDFEE